ncbi:MAG TPA: quinone-dependent dihydroorotate dehydrogenase [Candidatus Limnocylindria bacterium]|nr:quinone-dependent dihydroorotate dehydrogenase [Candidatus Limnocylindria bacterium]
MSGWRVAAYRAVRPLLFLVDAESIHHLTLRILGSPVGRALAPLASCVSADGSAAVELMGLHFRNRVGLGAGFDKDGVAIRGWAALGFGFVELGTVTPRPQAGNPRPRLFRLPGDEALINRMGFNNAGADALARRIADARPHLPDGFVVGVNIGRNRDTPDERAADDYAAAAGAVANVADYLVINVSSPNTPGLVNLQDPDRLAELLSVVRKAAPRPPLLVKLSSDLESSLRLTLADAVAAAGAAGVIVSNTTTDRDGVRSPVASETGGLSGRPLLDRTLAAAGAVAGRGLAVIASGGIGSGEDARQLLDAGADLVQLWTGMIYAGPGLIGGAVRAGKGLDPYA